MGTTGQSQFFRARDMAAPGLHAEFHEVGGGIDLGALAGELGAEIAAPLTAALERVNNLACTGQIDRDGLAALRAEIEGARRAGMVAQQLSRLAGGRIRQNPERLDLPQLLREAVSQRGREVRKRGLEVRQSLHSAHVIVDASLVFSLLQALLDWSLAVAQVRIDLAVDVKSWPVQARLVCRFAHRSADRVGPQQPAGTTHLDTIAWRLVQQTAMAMGLLMKREDTAEQTQLTLEFPRTVNEQMEGVSAIELNEDCSLMPNSKPVAGSHVLVLAARREIRTLVREAIRPMGLMLDFTTSVDEAREFCRSGLPHAIVFEAALAGERFEQLRREWLAELPSLAFIAIGDDGSDYVSTLRDGHHVTRVGRDAVMASLPSALLFELARGLDT